MFGLGFPLLVAGEVTFFKASLGVSDFPILHDMGKPLFGIPFLIRGDFVLFTTETFSYFPSVDFPTLEIEEVMFLGIYFPPSEEVEDKEGFFEGLGSSLLDVRFPFLSVEDVTIWCFPVAKSEESEDESPDVAEFPFLNLPIGTGILDRDILVCAESGIFLVSMAMPAFGDFFSSDCLLELLVGRGIFEGLKALLSEGETVRLLFSWLL